MMKLAVVTLFAFSAAGICTAQSSNAQTSVKHYRLTFVMSGGQGQQASETVVLDVPVMSGHEGRSSVTRTSSVSGEDGDAANQTLKCTDVHASATGLAATVNLTSESVIAPQSSSAEPLHRQFNFEQKIDVALGTPTRITQEMHRMPLKEGDASVATAPPAPPQITVTVVAM